MKYIIIDANAIIHRAFHALPPFTAPDGSPTGAVYGFTSILIKILKDLKPDYVLAAFDTAAPTFRHIAYEKYKAQREKAPDELYAQFPKTKEVLGAFNIPILEKDGFEADDIIGTLAKKIPLEDKKAGIIIVTGDMDTFQLVNKNVSVFTMRKGITDTVLYDELAVKERFGFGPKTMIDYKALRGDPSDNIPGVRGIGEKTATELVKEVGTIEELYKTLAKDPAAVEKRGVKPRIVQLLLEHKADAAFSKQLATIHPDVPIDFKLPPQHWHLADHSGTIGPALDELEFRSLKERLKGMLKPEDAAQVESADAVSVDRDVLQETSIALWLLRSDLTNPSLDDILNYTQASDFDEARKNIFTELGQTGRLASIFESIEKPLMPIVRRMNECGIYLDTKYLAGLEREYSKGLAELAGRIYTHAGREFNINSPKQLGDVLYDELKINPVRQKKTAGGARTTREEELAKLAPLHPIIGDVLACRELQKLLSTYIEKMPKLVAKDGRLHAEFLQAGTTTGRMSSQNPNLQNIPIKSEYGRRIREAFAAAKGFSIVTIDYSQIELRIAAGLSGDKKLVEIFQRGGDAHTAVAAEVFGVPPEHVDYEMRRRAKVINFGILYGMGVNALRANLGADVGRDEAAKFLDDYFKQFSGLARYIEKTKAEAARQGFTETLYGRRRYFPGFKSALPNLRAQAERMAINAPMQGTQSDIIKRAMVEADELIEKNGWREKVKLLMQVHDELVYEVEDKHAEEIARELRDIMENVADPKVLSGVTIVAEISIGKNWGNVAKVKRI